LATSPTIASLGTDSCCLCNACCKMALLQLLLAGLALCQAAGTQVVGWHGSSCRGKAATHAMQADYWTLCTLVAAGSCRMCGAASQASKTGNKELLISRQYTVAAECQQPVLPIAGCSPCSLRCAASSSAASLCHCASSSNSLGTFGATTRSLLSGFSGPSNM
jgi:hypothetical protein